MSVLKDLEDYYNLFCGDKFSIGKSLNGRDLFCFKVFKSCRPILIVQSAIHAREYVTTYLNLKLMEDFIDCGKVGTVYFLPLMNPDGVNICEKVDPLYKANARGVDLNVNFDARWGRGKSNVRFAGKENFIGEYAFSEPETVALRDFTLKIKPDMTLSYHSKGEEIYFEFFQNLNALKRDRIYAELVSEITGYQIKSTPFSAGGYKDWCIEKLNIPSLTIDVGSDTLFHPIEKCHVEEIFAKNRGVICSLTEKIYERQD